MASATELFVDKEFPPSEVSLGLGTNYAWARQEDLPSPPRGLFAGGLPAGQQPVGAHNVVQGCLDDCYLISAISLLARDSHLIQRLFLAYEPERGRCVVRLFQNSRWKEVVVDTLVPCFHDKRLQFARSRDGSEAFVPLLEKAYAKVYGSYRALGGGNMGEALLDLTGAPVEDVNLDRLTQEQLLGGELWCSLNNHFVGGDLIACGFFDAVGTAAGHVARGILPNHAYSVGGLAEPSIGVPAGKPRPKLLKVLNPWGHFEWTGPWSAGSPQWTEDLRKEVGVSDAEKEDGSFWMELKDFAQFFNRLHICRTGVLRAGQEVARTSFDVAVTKDTAGGCTNFPSFYRNTMFRFTGVPSGGGEVFVTVSQPDARREMKAEGCGRLSYPQIGITLLAQLFQPHVATDAQCCTPNRRRVVQKTSFWNKRDVALAFKPERLPAGEEYRVVPSCYFPEDPGMGGFTVNFSWLGSAADITVEQMTLGAQTDFTFTSRFAATNGGRALPLSQHGSFKVVAPEGSGTVAITVLLVKAPEDCREWVATDPLHAALRILFERFDVNKNQVLEPEELWKLLDEMANLAEDAVELDDLSRAGILRNLDLDGSGTVSFGQFLAQSSALAAAMQVPKPQFLSYLQALANPGSSQVNTPVAAVPAAKARAKTKAKAKIAPRRGTPAGNSRERSPSTGPSSRAGSARDIQCAVAPLRCLPRYYENAEQSLAPGCAKMPVMSNGAAWSCSFVVQEEEFYLCPFAHENGGTCTYELRVLSPMANLSVSPCPPGREPGRGSTSAPSTPLQGQTRNRTSMQPTGGQGSADLGAAASRVRATSPSSPTATNGRGRGRDSGSAARASSPRGSASSPRGSGKGMTSKAMAAAGATTKSLGSMYGDF
eukprot:TRINITY_DN3220_c0_g1_i1.p1 TRINITY_DN3220_c0_g1~~TRINITY_DN3220_c0_g1_i1.p1  ORF type:complete len:881 (-),score=142.06 TRINITY_DN3220_c0_g1_i1:427-3069(-)